jgi:hypothetical protein
MRAFVERTLAWLIAAVLVGCGGDGDKESSARYALGQEIPLGIINVSVTQWEEARGSSSPLGSLQPPPGEKPVAVFVRWSGLDEYAEFDRRTFVEAFLNDRLTLVDSDGFEYAALTAVPKGLYQFSAQAGSGNTAPPDWAVVFWAWVDSQDYKLRIEHPGPGEGDFDVAVVELP